MVTIKEIAQRSGYSPATVSRLLNNDQTLSVTQTTRNKILKVANQLGYWKDRKKPAVAPTIALLFRMNNQEQLQDSYFASLKDALLKTIEDAGMQVKVFQYAEELIDQAEEFQGFLCVGDDNVELNVFKRLHRLLPAGVFVDTDPLPHLFDSVQPNLSMTVRDALEQFADAGSGLPLLAVSVRRSGSGQDKETHGKRPLESWLRNWNSSRRMFFPAARSAF